VEARRRGDAMKTRSRGLDERRGGEETKLHQREAWVREGRKVENLSTREGRIKAKKVVYITGERSDDSLILEKTPPSINSLCWGGG